MKRCGRCGELLLTTFFNRNAARRDGLQALCQSCMRSYQAANYRKNRARHIARVREDNARRKAEAAASLRSYLLDHPCVDCGAADIRVLEFDHRADEVKTSGIADMVGTGVPWDRIVAEIAKCDVRCANCHRIRTAERGNFYRRSWLPAREQSS